MPRLKKDYHGLKMDQIDHKVLFFMQFYANKYGGIYIARLVMQYSVRVRAFNASKRADVDPYATRRTMLQREFLLSY